MNKILLLIGEIDLIKEFARLFSSDGKFLIAPTVKGNYYFEMAGEAAYYALQELEKNGNVSLKAEKDKIVQAVKLRLEYGNGRLLHQSLNKYGYDTQFRSTSAAIRLLIAAVHDGYTVNKEIKTIADYQFQHYFQWQNGIWFCHDSSELNGKMPWTHIKSKALGKHWRNTMTLNTHLDSLSTLMLLRLSDMQDLVDFNVDEYIQQGLIAINQLTSIRPSKLSVWLQNWDDYFFHKHIHCTSLGKENVIYERFIHPLCFKVFFPTIFFSDGYIGRDLAVFNRHLDYLVVNITDIARVISLYMRLQKRGIIDSDILNCKLLHEKIIKAIQLIEKDKNLQDIIMQDELQSAWLAEMYYTIAYINPMYKNKALTYNKQKKFCAVSPFFDVLYD